MYSMIYNNDIEMVGKVVPNIDKLRDKSVLVTGGCGLIGSAVVDLLLACNDLFNLNTTIAVGARSEIKFNSRFRDSPYFLECLFEEYDSLNPLVLSRDYDFIIHTANFSNPALYDSNPVETIQSIIYGTDYGLQYASKHPCRLLYISSSEVYGLSINNEPHGEEDYGYLNIQNPRACYPSGKRLAETLCSSYAKEYDVDVVIVRPGHIYGPTAQVDDNRVSSIFFYQVLQGKDLVLKSRGDQIRSYCYGPDCASAILTVLLNGERGEAYNISNRDSICSIRDLAEEIASVTGRKVLFANPSDAEKKSFNLMNNSSLISQKIELIGWHGLFDMKTGVNHTYEIIKENINCEDLS